MGHFYSSTNNHLLSERKHHNFGVRSLEMYVDVLYHWALVIPVMPQKVSCTFFSVDVLVPRKLQHSITFKICALTIATPHWHCTTFKMAGNTSWRKRNRMDLAGGTSGAEQEGGEQQATQDTQKEQNLPKEERELHLIQINLPWKGKGRRRTIPKMILLKSRNRICAGT